MRTFRAIRERNGKAEERDRLPDGRHYSSGLDDITTEALTPPGGCCPRPPGGRRGPVTSKYMSMCAVTCFFPDVVDSRLSSWILGNPWRFDQHARFRICSLSIEMVVLLRGLCVRS